ncbi:MAG: aminotransferase class I/II-fold pyridoxal phosphate-dependent enzyme [Silicimonas sp.]|nr:aminotransferase class I/II-fold pyridoxal phosphate-dependent enzyme [Silicimonas sp.]
MTKPPLLRARWPESVSRPVATPLQPSVVYASPDPDALDDQYEGRASGFTYAREGHPNADVLAGLIDRLEGAEGGVVTGSGMSAVTLALLSIVKAGDHVLGADQLYGRSLRLMQEELPRMGIATSVADPTDLKAFEAGLRPETRAILIETVANPTLRIADLRGIIALGQARGIPVVVDNTFTTPALINPLQMGADVLVHSVTKMLAGHSDATLGYVAARDPEIRARLSVLSATLGLTASPFDCWLAERGLYTFEMRFERASRNAETLAATLADHVGVKRVLYPTRPDHPDHNRAQSLLTKGGGNMVSFELDGGRAAANTLVRALDQIAFAPTLGDIATTLSHPASSSHRALTADARAALGMSEGFFRVSVGCEDPDQLTGAFAQALDQL